MALDWSEDETIRSFLQDLSRNDDVHVGARRAAVQGLGLSRRQGGRIREFLEDLAKNDKERGVRAVAMEALASGWQENDEILEFVRSCAQTDSDTFVRIRAVQALISEQVPEISILLSRVLTTDSDLDLDPLEPLRPEHVTQAAGLLQVDEVDLRHRLAECQEILGWNLLEGLKSNS